MKKVCSPCDGGGRQASSTLPQPQCPACLGAGVIEIDTIGLAITLILGETNVPVHQ
jgi:DnaJ-class molecular chaperone